MSNNWRHSADGLEDEKQRKAHLQPKPAFIAAVRSEKMRFLLVGGYNTAFGYCFFVALIFLFGDQVHYLIILPISHLVSVSNAYFAYRLFVFPDATRGLKSYLRFHSVYLASLGFGMIALPLLVELAGLSPAFAQGILLAVIVVFSYFLHKQFSFAV